MKAQLDYPPTPPHLITSLETQSHRSEQTGLSPQNLFHFTSLEGGRESQWKIKVSP